MPYGRYGFFYGWLIVAAAFVILWLTQGMTLAGLTVFDEVLLDAVRQTAETGDLRGAFKLRDTITMLAAGLLSPVAGALADRIGVRPLMVGGLLILAAGIALYSNVTSLVQIYVIHALLGVALACCGLVLNIMIVSRWFVRRRGLAIGIALAGTSLGNAAFPQLNAWLITELGWRSAFAWSGLLPLALIPVVVLVMRERPADLGPESPQAGAAASGRAAGMSFHEALRTSNFWILAFIAMGTFYAVLAMATHLFLHMRGQGFDVRTAATGISVMFLLGLFGKIGSGLLADRLGDKWVLVGSLSIMCGGAWLLVSTNQTTFWPALVLFGLGWGGLYTLLQLLVADCFGLKDLGKILGTITVLNTLGGALGPSVTGLLFDRFHSYTVPFTVIATLVLLATLLATGLRLVPDRQETVRVAT
mgnify:CR=1 FL=1